MEEDEDAVASKRNQLQTLLQAKIPNLVINGDPHSRLAGNLHISIPGIPNSAVIARVRNQLAISRGSACSSGVEAPSHVLRARHLPEEVTEVLAYHEEFPLELLRIGKRAPRSGSLQDREIPHSILPLLLSPRKEIHHVQLTTRPPESPETCR